MAVLKRKDEQLTTAELAGREPRKDTGRAVEDPSRPKLVRSETSEVRARPIATPETDMHAQEERTATALFSASDRDDLRKRWSDVQTGFVDEPRKAVESADNLVASVMKRLAEGFANERATLEKQWDRGDNVSTEDLRVALQRYRSFFDRLLNA